MNASNVHPTGSQELPLEIIYLNFKDFRRAESYS